MSTQLSLLPSGRFWVVTLTWPVRGTYGPFSTERAAGQWAAKHGWPQSAFVVPVLPPETEDAARERRTA